MLVPIDASASIGFNVRCVLLQMLSKLYTYALLAKIPFWIPIDARFLVHCTMYLSNPNCLQRRDPVTNFLHSFRCSVKAIGQVHLSRHCIA